MFNFIFALVLSTACLEALLLLSGSNISLFYLMQYHGTLITVLLHALMLYWFCIRKPLLQNRKEYLISTELGHCGEVSEFDKSKYSNLKRSPLDYILCLFAGVRTYHTDTSEFYTTYRGAFSVPFKRIAAAVLCIFIWLCPLSLPHYLNNINAEHGQIQYDAGKSKTPYVYPTLKEYDGVFSITKLTDNLFKKDKSAESTAAADTPQDTTDNTANTDTDSNADNEEKTGFFAKIGSFFQGFFKDKTDTNSSNANYLLPSDSREITEDDIAGLSRDDIQLRINEMYARHGYVFTGNASAAEYFSQQDWYSPDDSLTQDDISAQFSALERKNLDFLSAHLG